MYEPFSIFSTHFKWGVLFFFVILAYGCHRGSPSELPYCSMNSRDQSFVNNNKKDIEKYNKDREKRLRLIEENYEMLMGYARRNGFPYIDFSTQESDSCKFWAVTMTMLHAAQGIPSFYSEKSIRFFKKEMDKGNITKQLLEQCLIVADRTTTDFEAEIKRASEAWGVSVD